MVEQMAAAVLGGPGEIYLTQKPRPSAGKDEVLIEVRRASLCGTDLKIRDRSFFDGEGPEPGVFTPGHEYAGVVVEVGDTVDEVEVGDRVVGEPHRGCMRCRTCLAGDYTSCLNSGSVAKGHRTVGMTVDGGFAEYVVNHVSGVHRIPESLEFEEAVMLTTAGTGIHAIANAGHLLLGASAVVMGPGPIGLLVCQLAKQLAGDLVVLTGTRKERLDVGARLGADVVVDVTEEDVVPRVRNLVPDGVDLVFECSGSGAALNDALRLVRRGGTIVVAGFYSEAEILDINRAVMNGIRIETVRGEGPDAISRAASLARQGRLNVQPLITHRVALPEISDAFDIYEERRDGAMKVVIDMTAARR